VLEGLRAEYTKPSSSAWRALGKPIKTPENSEPRIASARFRATLEWWLVVGWLVRWRTVFIAFDAIELGNARGFAFPDAMGDAVFLIFPAAEFAFDLDVSAALERTGKFSELGPTNDTVPFGPGFPIAGVFVLPRLLGSDGKNRNGNAAIRKPSLSILSCKSDE
jgi:hypothetical protein